jgi:diaminopimelate decarboxylase
MRQLAMQAAALIEAHGLDDTTYIYDLGNTTRLFKAWCGALPRVMPFYAVKCNPEVGSSNTDCWQGLFTILHVWPLVV